MNELAQFVWVYSRLNVAPSSKIMSHWFACFKNLAL
eukprot:CAMPEP_0185855182 /NCGR_PEP_ID=MMETSP1354-20130828/24910_1 /TAXON_ID=708628 /ORGANISM="Erythrolobus madagascarensis, Strain CCMP3276" /LENGTH=35 /DNA_ID= /DNA_START= /DNA_END= /DNA_ORIENTATION=